MQTLKLLTHFDHSIFYKCTSSNQQSQLCKSIKIISKTGDGYLQIILPILLALAFSLDSFIFLELMILLNVCERTVYFILKNTCKRKRPPDKLLDFKSIITASDKFSFPSGHASSAFLLATIIVIHFGAPFLWLYLWASAVGASRVFLGVHFPSDIIAGAILGSSIALLSSQLF